MTSFEPYAESAFEATIERELLSSGWHPWSPDHYDKALGLDTGDLDAFIGATQHDAWERLITSYGDAATAQREFAKRVAREIDLRGTLDVLRTGVKDRGVNIDLAYFRPGHTLAANALDEYHANRLTVARQLHYSTRDASKSLDLVLLLNGIPVATAELKSPMTAQSWTVEDAKRQYREDRDPAELIFARRTLVHFAVDPDQVFLTTRLAGRKTRFLPFNVGSLGPGRSGGAGNPPAGHSASPTPDSYATAYLWRQIWQRDNFLELLQRYVHVQLDSSARRGGRQDPHKAPLIFPRYHQWHAVQTMVAHAESHGAGSNYLIEHSAGSGKSNTIAWLAHRLSRLHTPGDVSLIAPDAREAGLGPNVPVFDKVVVITDRVVLDRQLQDTIYQFDHVPGVVKKIDEDSAQLADALTGSAARIIITTLQKFPYVLRAAADLRQRRYAVIVDEAHSSQSGESAAALKRALGAYGGSDEIDDDGDVLTASALARGRHPNLSYFAFTATPKHKTLLLFGTPDTEGTMRPFHIYSMRQAIDEGFILDVLANYTTYKARWRLRNTAVEQSEQSAIANPEVDPRKAKASLIRLAELHPTSQEQRAKIIVDHFRDEVAHRLGGRAKAMVVTRSREHALRLYQAISTYVAQLEATDCAPLVAFSGKLTVEDIDYTEPQLNGFSEAALPEKFAYTAADDQDAATVRKTEYRILVVAEKYQTGFDQPLLTAMYVDKPLKDVAAVQTLSRLNRIHPAKTQDDVLVLDLVNEADAIQEAFRPYFETTITEVEDPNLLYDKQRAVMDFQLLVVSEMDAFVRALAEARATGTTTAAAKDEQVHARLYRHLQPAVDRFVDLAQDDVEHAEEFRSALGDYVRAYGLLAQVVGFSDQDLERLYQYGRVLLNRLPRRPAPSVDIGDTDLSHLALNKVAEERLSLAPAGDQLIPGFSMDGAGFNTPEQQPLSEVIEELNRKFGLDLGTAHQILVVQQIISLAEDERMQAIALMNDEEKFNQVADDKLDHIVAENMENNAEFGQLYFDNPEFQAVLRQTMRKRAFQLINSPARDEAIGRMRALRAERTAEP